MKALLDSDILAYRISFACKDETAEHAAYSLNSYIADIITRKVDTTFPDCFVDSWELFLTGSNNFRLDIAKTAVYKGHRPEVKPVHLAHLREHMTSHWGAVVIEGEEADDAIATRATQLGDYCVIVSLDKDLDQVSGWHFNFVKDIGYYVTPEEGMLNLYKQILTGDTADNIIGLKGVGPVKANKLLADITDELDLYNACLEAYDGNEDRVLENARLLWLRRFPNQMWNPPTKD